MATDSNRCLLDVKFGRIWSNTVLTTDGLTASSRTSELSATDWLSKVTFDPNPCHQSMSNSTGTVISINILLTGTYGYSIYTKSPMFSFDSPRKLRRIACLVGHSWLWCFLLWRDLCRKDVYIRIPWRWVRKINATIEKMADCQNSPADKKPLAKAWAILPAPKNPIFNIFAVYAVPSYYKWLFCYTRLLNVNCGLNAWRWRRIKHRQCAYTVRVWRNKLLFIITFD